MFRTNHWVVLLALVTGAGCGSSSSSGEATTNGVGGTSRGAGGSSGGSSGTSATAGQGGSSPTTGGSAGESGAAGAGGSDDSYSKAASDLAAAIDDHETDADFTLVLGNHQGVFFSHSKGDSSETTVHESASTSKWVTAAVLLHLVDEAGADSFSLSTKANELLAGWTDASDDPRSEITLTHLLSFTSGLEFAEDESVCTLLGTGTIQTCVARIYADAADLAQTPGEHFVYGSNHLQVAGLMTMRHMDATTWGEVFEAFKVDTGLFPNGRFDLPNEDNPRLAGGMHWTASEYVEFLAALFEGELLSEASRAAMFSDHTPEDAVSIDYSPVLAGVGEDWHYGLGVWLECHEPAFTEGCLAARRFSSPGAYGAYPFIDFGRGYYGILAQQEGLGSFRDGHDLEAFIDALVAVAP